MRRLSAARIKSEEAIPHAVPLANSEAAVGSPFPPAQQEDAKAKKKVEQLLQKTRALDEIRQREKQRHELRQKVSICLPR